MRRRASLAQFMALIVILASGLAAMKVASLVVSQALFGLSFLALLVGTLGAMVRDRRAAWVGFSLFGWAYALVALVPAIHSTVLPGSPLSAPILRFVEWLHPPIPPPPKPLPFDAWKEGDRYLRVARGMAEDFQPSPDETKAIEEYEILARPSRNRYEASQYAPTIAYVFLGMAFALSGAILGALLSDRSSPAIATPPVQASNAGR